MKIKVIIAAALLALLNACIPSVYPLYSPDTIVKEPLLNGVWMSGEDGEDKWEFTMQKDHSYKLILTEKNQPATFEAYLVKLGDQLYMDFYPVTIGENKNTMFGKDLFGDLDKNGFYFLHFFPVHTFAKVNLREDQLGIMLFNPKFLEELFEQRKVRIRHETTPDDNILLTAPTRDLQKFIKKYGEEKNAFDEDALELLRKR